MPRRPRPLCAICAERTADTITDWECESGRTLASKIERRGKPVAK